MKTLQLASLARRSALGVVAIMGALEVCCAPGAAAAFIPLPTPAGCTSTGIKINIRGSATYNVTCPAGGQILVCQKRVNRPAAQAYYFDGQSHRAIPLRLPPGALRSQAFDIDDNNFVVGTSIYNANGFKRYPTVWSPSCAANAYPEPTSTDARGVNPTAGANAFIVGQTGVGTALPQAARILPPPAPLMVIGPAPNRGQQSELNDVNDAGIAVGQLNHQAASSLLPAAMALLPGFPLGQSSWANAINASGVIVGGIVSATPPAGCASSGYAFQSAPLAEPKTLAPIKGDCLAVAEDLNDDGMIVGFSTSPANVKRAVIFSLGGQAGDLNTTAPYRNLIVGAGWMAIDVSGVNDNGQMVGTAVNKAGQQEAFVIL